MTSATSTTAPAAAPPIRLSVHNLVATSKAADALDLPALAARIPGAEYDQRRFPGLIVRMRSPRLTALIFNSGKVILTGLPDPDALPAAYAAVLEALRTAGADLDPAPRPPKIVNLVASGTFPDGIALHRMAIALNLENVEYEPESFPGLVFRCQTVRAVALVFATGAIVVAGVRTLEDATAAAAEFARTADRVCVWIPSDTPQEHQPS